MPPSIVLPCARLRTYQIFLDGAPGTAATLDAATEGPYLHVGGTPNYPFFAGDLDEIRLSCVARYNGSFTPPSGPFSPDGDTLALYHLNEGSGQAAADETPNQYDLTLGASPTVENSDPSWVSGNVTSTARERAAAAHLTTTSTRSIAYTYDGLNRLTGADESGSTTNRYRYGYDLAGNPRRRRV
jgi:YD repeat-containing protein